MRISLKEKQAIQEAITQYADHRAVKIFLFGSRVDDSQYGGDIDIACIVEKNDLEYFRLKKHYITSAIKMALGDQKIDLLFGDRDLLEQSPFWSSISQKWLLL